MKVGRKPNNSIKSIVLKILGERSMQTPESVKKRYKEIMGFGVGWKTIRNCLDKLYDDGIINKKVLNETDSRTIVVFSLISK